MKPESGISRIEKQAAAALEENLRLARRVALLYRLLAGMVVLAFACGAAGYGVGRRSQPPSPTSAVGAVATESATQTVEQKMTSTAIPKPTIASKPTKEASPTKEATEIPATTDTAAPVDSPSPTSVQKVGVTNSDEVAVYAEATTRPGDTTQLLDKNIMLIVCAEQKRRFQVAETSCSAPLGWIPISALTITQPQ